MKPLPLPLEYGTILLTTQDLCLYLDPANYIDSINTKYSLCLSCQTRLYKKDPAEHAYLAIKNVTPDFERGTTYLYQLICRSCVYQIALSTEFQIEILSVFRLTSSIDCVEVLVRSRIDVPTSKRKSDAKSRAGKPKPKAKERA